MGTTTLPVGVSVLIVNSKNQILLGRRKNNTASGLLSTPGGRIEQNEDMFQCAIRECYEEVGIVPGTMEVIGFKEHFRFGNHYIMFYIMTNSYEGIIENKEPEKCEGWLWFNVNRINLEECTEPKEILEKIKYLNNKWDNS